MVKKNHRTIGRPGVDLSVIDTRKIYPRKIFMKMTGIGSKLLNEMRKESLEMGLTSFIVKVGRSHYIRGAGFDQYLERISNHDSPKL